MRGCLQKAKTAKRDLRKGEASWNIILSLGRGADGKYKQKWVRFHGTRQQAEAKLTELVGQHDRGELVEPSKLTVGAYLDEWLATTKSRRATGTHRLYTAVVKNHLKPAFGHVLLQKLNVLHIERYYADRANIGSPARCRRASARRAEASGSQEDRDDAKSVLARAPEHAG